MSKYEKIIILMIWLVPVGIIIAVPWGLYIFKDMQCSSKARSFESHDFSIVSGCMVEYKDQWLPLENIRGFGDE